MTFSLKKEGLAICGILLACVLLAAAGLRRDLDAENRLTAKRLAHAFIPLLAKAHHAKDDLALQEAVTALAQAPGVSLACVMDLDEKVIAHNHLADIGKPFDGLRAGDEVHSFPLKDGAERWGTLLFYLSANSLHRLWTQWIFILAVSFMLISVAYGIRLGIEARRLRTLGLALADQITLGQEKQKLNQNLGQTLAETQRQSRAGFQIILEKFPEPVLLLDAHQRVVAFNSEAGHLLGLEKKENWINASWQDVPWLQDQGAALERSLQTPHADILVEDTRYKGALRTEAPWTWVQPRHDGSAVIASAAKQSVNAG